MHAAVVTHGGTDTPPDERSGCEDAAALALSAMAADEPGDALAAAIEAVVRLEGDGRYNAGLGALPGMDGRTIELDAAIMDSTGRLGAVACIQGVRHPVRVARRVADIPLVGCGHYAGEHGAVACTGVGEHVVRRHVALRVHDLLARGTPLREALQAGLRLVPHGLQIGLIGVDRHDAAVASSQPMACAVAQGR